MCYSFAPIYSKNQKFRWGRHPYYLYIDIIVSTFIFIRNTKEIVLFSIFFKLSKINFNYIHVKNNQKLTLQANLLFGLLPCQLTKICKNCMKDVKHINISFIFYKKSTKCCRSVVNFLLNSCANL